MTKRLANLVLVLALLGINSNQAVTRGYIYSNIGTTFAWSGSAQTGWSGSNQAATCSDFTTYIHNDGTACPGAAAGALVQYGFATAHAVVSNIHSPILSNNSFAGGSMTSWTSANVGSCNGATFSPGTTGDEDADNGFVGATSLSCFATAAQLTLVQTFTTGGAPTSQTYSFWYKAPLATSGSSDCTLSTGTASLSVKIGSTVIATPTITLDGAWHQVSGSMSAMVSGSNTLTFTATLQGAKGSVMKYNPQLKEYLCSAQTTTAQQGLDIDNVVLSGVW